MRFARTARTFVTRALSRRTMPVEVTTDQAPVYPAVIEQFAPQAQHVSEPYANNIVEAHHGRPKSTLRPMRGLKRPARCAPSGPGTRSCRICAAATMNSPPTGRPVIVYVSHSANSLTASEAGRQPNDHPPTRSIDQRNSPPHHAIELPRTSGIANVGDCDFLMARTTVSPSKWR
jgi:hypothetical protein